MFECEALGCRWKHMQDGMAARITKVYSKGGTCPHCVELREGIEYAIKVEQTISNEPDVIDKLLDTEKQRRNATQLKRISEICYESTPGIPAPNTNRARKLIQAPLRYMVRRIANTLLLDLHSNSAGFDATISETIKGELCRRATMICTGCESEGEGNRRQRVQTEQDDRVAAICNQCGHLQRKDELRPAKPSDQCPYCSRRRHGSEGISRQPCRVCVSQWLLRNNGTAKRREQAIAQLEAHEKEPEGTNERRTREPSERDDGQDLPMLPGQWDQNDDTTEHHEMAKGKERKRRMIERSMKEIIQRRQGGISITTIGTERRKEKRKQEKRHDKHRHQTAKKPKIEQIQEADGPMLDASIKQYFGILCSTTQMEQDGLMLLATGRKWDMKN